MAINLARPWAEPVTSEAFARLMESFEPFEPTPHLAVAVSGGIDSTALTLFAAAWARARGGRATALTVDHGLRPESARESAQVASWCAARGIAHAGLRWSGPRPASGIQAAARAARYKLLEEWCCAHGVFHLLVAHQREDQAETVLMRLLRGSGVDGLAGMAAVVEHGVVRVLRPLLSVPRKRLEATLAAEGQAWIEDPSNRNPAYLRAKLRAEVSAFGARGLSIERLAGMASQFGRARVALEAGSAALLARAVAFHPAGFVWLDPEPFVTAPEALGLKALAALLTTVSGADYPPRRERLERLFRLLPQALGGGRTLGGCLLLPRRGKVLVCREPAAAAPPTPARPGAATRWDRRFTLNLEAAAPRDWQIGALGPDAALIRDRVPAAAWAAVPAAARFGLPALRNGDGIVAVPALDYLPRCEGGSELSVRVAFRPTRPLAAGRFTIV